MINRSGEEMDGLIENQVKKLHIGLISSIAVIIFLFNGWVIHQVIHVGNISIIDENNLVENIQVVCYAFSALILFVNSMRVSKLNRWLNLFFGVTCLSFVFRELDVEKLNVPEALILLGSGKGRNIMFVILFAMLFVVFLRNYKYALSNLKNLFGSPVVQICLVGCLLLMLGAVGDENDMKLLEEVSEMNGAKLIAISALFFVYSPRLLMDYITEPAGGETMLGSRK